MSNSHSQPLNLSGSHPGAISRRSLDSSFNSANSMDKTDLTNPSVLAHLTDCLLFACVTDDTRSLSVRLGLPESLCDHDALSAWILTETQNIKFIDASALFNYLANQLDAILNNQWRGSI